jgi:chromosome segregation ATPase
MDTPFTGGYNTAEKISAISGQIGDCRGELDIARQHKEEARIKMLQATDEFNAAYGTVETLERNLRGLKDELYSLQKQDPAWQPRVLIEQRRKAC